MSEEQQSPYKRENKRYELKPSAARAARQDGLVDGQYELREEKIKGKNSKWYYVVTDVHKDVKEQLEQHKATQKAKFEPKPESAKVEEPKKVEPVRKTAKQIAEELYRQDMEEIRRLREEEEKKNPTPEPVVVSELPPEKKDVKSATSGLPTRVVKQVEAKVKATKAPRSVADDNKIHKSQVESPTKRVWHIADEMTTANPGTTRKQVIEECTRQGIAYYTARTQYQQWLTSQRESKINAAKANGKKK